LPAAVQPNAGAGGYSDQKRGIAKVMRAVGLRTSRSRPFEVAGSG